MICVHARTKEQQYAPGIDLSIIEKTKNALNIPVVGNGDIYTARDAIDMMEKTGCDGVMIGRGAQGNPWLFSEISCLMNGKEYTPPTLIERFETALKHLDDEIHAKGERVGIAEAKKHMAWYVAGIKGAASARARVMTATCPDDIKEIFTSLINEKD
jgi:tRNA-dihydrouridine synthase B